MDATKINVAPSGLIRVAPYGTPLPTSPTVNPNAAFFELGYVSEDGVTFSAEPTVEDVRAWQSADPIARLVTARALTIAAQGMEWDRDTFALGFGGGDWTDVAGGYRYDPPANTDDLAEYSIIVDAFRGPEVDRWVIKRGNITEAVETQMQRGAASLLPFSFAALAPDGEDNRAWYFLTTDDKYDENPS